MSYINRLRFLTNRIHIHTGAYRLVNKDLFEASDITIAFIETSFMANSYTLRPFIFIWSVER